MLSNINTSWRTKITFPLVLILVLVGAGCKTGPERSPAPVSNQKNTTTNTPPLSTADNFCFTLFSATDAANLFGKEWINQPVGGQVSASKDNKVRSCYAPYSGFNLFSKDSENLIHLSITEFKTKVDADKAFSLQTAKSDAELEILPEQKYFLVWHKERGPFPGLDFRNGASLDAYKGVHEVNVMLQLFDNTRKENTEIYSDTREQLRKIALKVLERLPN